MVGSDIRDARRARVRTAARALVWACTITLLAGAAAQAARLTDVRVGLHADKTRVVIESDGTFTHRIVEEAGGESVLIDVNAASAPRIMSAKGPHLRSVVLTPKGDGTSVRLLLRGDAELRSFGLSKPDRLVIDLYTKGKAPGAAKKTAAAPAPPPARTPTQKAAAPTPAKKPVPPPPVAPKPKAEPKPPAPSPAAAQKPKPPVPSPAAAPKPAPAGASPEGTKPPAGPTETARADSAGKRGAASPGSAKSDFDEGDSPELLEGGAVSWDELAAEDVEVDAQGVPDGPVVPDPPSALKPGPAVAKPPPATASGQAAGAGIPRSTILLGALGLALVSALVIVLARRRGGDEPGELETPTSRFNLDDVLPSHEDATDEGVSEESPAPAGDVTSTAPWPATSGEEPATAEPVAPAEGDDDSSIFETPASDASAEDLEQTAVNPVAPPPDLDLPAPSAGATPGFRSGTPVESITEPVIAPAAAAAAAPDDAPEGEFMKQVESRLGQLENRIEELATARERLERQVVAQTEELRVQRAAIARTQRVLRGMSRPEDEPSEPVPKV